MVTTFVSSFSKLLPPFDETAYRNRAELKRGRVDYTLVLQENTQERLDI